MRKTSYTLRNETFLPHILKKFYFIFSRTLRDFHFFVYSFLFVFISSLFFPSCFRFFRYFYCWLYLFTSLFLRFCVVTATWVYGCYEFERASFTLRWSLPYTPSCFYQGFDGADSSALKVAGLPTEFRSIDPTHMFVSITRCLAVTSVRNSI